MAGCAFFRSGLAFLMTADTLRMECIGSCRDVFIIRFDLMAFTAGLRIGFTFFEIMMAVTAGNIVTGFRCMHFVGK